MSDEEVSRSESEEEEEESESEDEAPADTGPTEAEVAMAKRKREEYRGLDESAQDLLEQNRVEREQMEKEIREMRAKNERRKKERAAEDRRTASKRLEEENGRKAEEEERRKKKEEDEQTRRAERELKMAEFEKMKNPQKRNFIITKRDGAPAVDDEAATSSGEEKKSREQLEAERKAILSQRIQPLEISGFDSGKLGDKAKELLSLIVRLESEKYDLEKQFKEQQIDMMELAERARQMNKVDRQGLKRLMDEVDKIQERFAGAPSKIVMYSQFERQKDKRSYVDRRTIFTGAQYGFAASKISPTKTMKWSEDGLPIYEEMEEGAEGEQAAAAVAVE